MYFFADSVTENIPRQLSRQCQCVCVCVCVAVLTRARWTYCVFAQNKYSEAKSNNFLCFNLPWGPQPGTADCYLMSINDTPKITELQKLANVSVGCGNLRILLYIVIWDLKESPVINYNI